MWVSIKSKVSYVYLLIKMQKSDCMFSTDKKSLWIMLFVFFWVWVSGWHLGVNLGDFRDLGNSIDFIGNMWPLDFSMLENALLQTYVTVEIAFLGTVFGLFVAFPLAFFAARNTTPNGAVYNAVRSLLSFLRSIPELVIALVFVATFGLEPMTVIIAIFIHNIGVLGKLISELIESVNPGPQEAVASTGAKRILVSLYGVVPQIMPNVLSHYFYRFEVAIRASILFGVIGAGGIGDTLLLHFKLFEYGALAVDILIVMVVIMIVDNLGAYFRSKVI
jgi:phosphonate transport system permease protein